MPPSPTDLYQRAQSARQSGRLDEAENLYRQFLSQSPQHAIALHHLAIIRYQRGDPREAAALLEQSITLHPASPEAHSNLSVFLLPLNRTADAIAAARTSLQLNPNYTDGWINLGNALFKDQQLDPAIEAFQKAITLNPKSVQALMNLGNVLKRKGDYDGTLAAYRQGLAIAPPSAEALTNLANALKDIGEIDECVATYRRAVELAPHNPVIHSNLLYALHFHPESTPHSLAAEHRVWNQRHGNGRIPQAIVPIQTPTDRPLRVAYLSPDLSFHPVGRFMLPILSHHDRSNFEIYVYSDASPGDPFNARLRAAAPDHWHDTGMLNFPQLAELIHSHKIDILVDLTMHMARNRLPLFARRVAPLQLTYLAYCSTTGLTSMDYRLSDPHLDSAPIDPAIYSERTLHLPKTYWCYPLDNPPPIGPLPALTAGHITFTCLNNFGKITKPTLETWSAILAAVPNSQLLLYAPEGSHRQRTKDFFSARDVAANRIHFSGAQSFSQYLELYNQTDIALDPFPCAGGTTSCDALSMGNPLITLAGNTAVGRSGVSILSQLQLEEFIAHTPDDYVQIATQLAANTSRLSDLRSTLRTKMAQSPLCNAPAFVQSLESLYRKIWQDKCGG